MLRNDPPPGTKVRLVRDVRTAGAGDTATLVRPMQKFEVDRASDEFEVEFQGEKMTVKRVDIEEA